MVEYEDDGVSPDEVALEFGASYDYARCYYWLWEFQVEKVDNSSLLESFLHDIAAPVVTAAPESL